MKNLTLHSISIGQSEYTMPQKHSGLHLNITLSFIRIDRVLDMLSRPLLSLLLQTTIYETKQNYKLGSQVGCQRVEQNSDLEFQHTIIMAGLKALIRIIQIIVAKVIFLYFSFSSHCPESSTLS
ncbi:hypothetical protein CIPAW_05G165600 [Carya illinoinensis]|uniref:Uncharacterized protein n=1 Tax=Carya illinoinensis TaxID=32201 RepID=A0A8T1QK75_CARIL|nr:hypothetical protein CIPAW_05G165600 [Carya illinoinensis]